MSVAAPRILVVEDDRDIREALVMWLEIQRYEVAQAADGLDALAALQTQPLPDLILLDMLMPRMNGWELVDAIRKDPSSTIAKIPIIAVTATSEKVQRSPGDLQGVIRKPFELEEVDQVLRRFFPKPGL